MPSSVTDIGDHDYCVVHTYAETLWINQNWSLIHGQGKINSTLAGLVKNLPHGSILVKAYQTMNILDYVRVRWCIYQSTLWHYCAVYAVDDAPWRSPKIRTVKGNDHIDIFGIKPGGYRYVEAKLEDKKYVKVYAGFQ